MLKEDSEILTIQILKDLVHNRVDSSKYKQFIERIHPQVKFPNHPSFSTICIHSTQLIEDGEGIMPGIELSLTYKIAKPDEMFNQEYVYQRMGNKTRNKLEKAISALENAEYTLVFSSGIGAVAAVLQTLRYGDNIIAPSDIYPGTYSVLDTWCHQMHGINFKQIQFDDLTNLENAIDANTKLVWIETPTNPKLQLIDIEAVVKICKEKNVLICADNTIATPYLLNPLNYGVDIVINSCSKYISGHSDITLGSVSFNNEQLFKNLSFIQKSCGTGSSPFDCYLAIRGLKTLKLRMHKQCENAFIMAHFLRNHPKVIQVYFPGFQDSPYHELANKFMRAYGGVVTFKIDGALQESIKFIKNLKYFVCGVSFGSVESLVQIPRTMTHRRQSLEKLDKDGITENMIRMSLGAEDIEDLLEDVDQALNKI